MLNTETALVPQTKILADDLSERIYTVRGCQVMLDVDLAEIYEVPNKALKQAVRRNIERFPIGFLFEITKEEDESLRSQSVTSSEKIRSLRPCLRSQNVSSNEKTCSGDQFDSGMSSKLVISRTSGRGGNRYAPFAFTEPGVAMLSAVLGSQRAIEVHINITRAFAHFRRQMARYESIFAPKLEALEKGVSSLESTVAELSRKVDRFIDLHQTQKTIVTQPRARNKVVAIQQAVAKHCGRQVEELKSPMRDRAISQARQIAIYFMRKHLGMTLTAIGYELGNRHHTTILYDCQKAYMNVEENETVRLIIGSIQNEIGPLLAA